MPLNVSLMEHVSSVLSTFVNILNRVFTGILTDLISVLEIDDSTKRGDYLTL